MATWQDGPEYAPHERPAAFVTPAAPPLAAAAAVAAVPPAPADEPTFTAPDSAQPDLATLVPAAAPGRNPTVPFDVSSAAITAGSGSWSARDSSGAAGDRPPTQPFTAPGPPLAGYLPVQPAVQPNAQVNPARFPAPNTPQWFAPPPETRVPAPPPPVTISQIWHAATPGVLIPLLLGIVFWWLSIIVLGVSFLLSARIGYRRPAVRRAYSVTWILLGLTFLLTLLQSGDDPQTLFESVSGTARLACVALPVVLGLIVGSALRAGERPDRIA